MNIEVQIEDDLDQVITMNVDYSIQESEPDTGTIGGIVINRIEGAWMNVVASWAGDDDLKGEIIMPIDTDKLDLAELQEQLEKEIKKYV